MNQKTAKKLRKLCRNPDGTPNRDRFKNLKKNWNNVPWKERSSLMAALERAAKITI